MNNNAMRTLANQVPTSMEELTALGILGENVVKEYGERLVKNINSFLQQNDLQEYISRRAPKRSKSDRESGASSASCNSYQTALVDLTEEYEFGVDLSAVELP